MRLTFEPFDGRSGHYFIEVFDQDTGDMVGYFHSEGAGSEGAGVYVSLFGGKYTMRVHGIEECLGFLRGVEAVLVHMTSGAQQAKKTDKSAAA